MFKFYVVNCNGARGVSVSTTNRNNKQENNSVIGLYIIFRSMYQESARKGNCNPQNPFRIHIYGIDYAIVYSLFVCACLCVLLHNLRKCVFFCLPLNEGIYCIKLIEKQGFSSKLLWSGKMTV